MPPGALVQARRALGWTQSQAARLLGISQSYLSMLEGGERTPPAALARKAANLYRLPPTALDLPAEPRPSADDLAAELAALGYPGFPRVKTSPKRNPAEVLVISLASPDLDARIAEALPWLLLQYPEMDQEWIVRQAKVRDLQNRLGFVALLARRIAEAGERYRHLVHGLAHLESTLEKSRLAGEDTFCRGSMTNAEREWLRQARPPEAAHWNLVTSLTREQLRYAA